MSRLFEIPVGVLLGVEEDNPASPAAEELTNRDLEAIEAIVKRYLEQAQPPEVEAQDMAHCGGLGRGRVPTGLSRYIPARQTARCSS